MSNAAQAWAWKQKTGHSTRKSILIALADHADHLGRCWPGHDGIAEKVECDRRTVIRHIRQLERDGFLTVTRRRSEKGRQISNLYELRMTDWHPDVQGDASSRVTPAAPPPGDTGDRSRVTRSTEPGDTGVIPEGDTDVTGTVKGTTKEPSVEPAPAPSTPTVHDDDRSRLARTLLQAFNSENGSMFQPGAYLLRIIDCVRSQPRLSEGEHLAVVAWSMRNPWWRDSVPHPGVIWGSTAQYERQVEGWRQAESGRSSVEDSEYETPVRVIS
ncbi:MAG TPA: helix-turn-helix domain-containing protein [Solirubrobacterales bacterium]|nr:helix-turn-helix domain-containing protein [Solirubrobacterales bacterium]